MAYTEEEVVLLFHDDRLRITITTVINTIQNMSGLNEECGMSVGCISVSDWSSSVKQLHVPSLV